MINRHNSLRVADKILAILDKKLRKNKDIWIECFSNCREQGYVIKKYVIGMGVLNVAFAENRSSEDIVVYFYEKAGIDNLPVAQEWDNKQYFKAGHYNTTANFIIEKLQGDEIYAKVSNNSKNN